MIIAVSGWRNWREKSSIVTVIGSIIDKNWAKLTYSSPDYGMGELPLFRFGDCPTGVDHIMWELVAEWHLPYQRYEADWEQHGKAAGPLRNRAMLRGERYMSSSRGLRANLLLAFPEPNTAPKIPGSGTWGCIGEAAMLGIQTVIYPSHQLTNQTGYDLEVFTRG